MRTKIQYAVKYVLKSSLSQCARTKLIYSKVLCLCTVSLIDSASGKIRIFIQTLKVGANDRSAQQLKHELQNEIHTNFLTEVLNLVWQFKIIPFCIIKDYSVNFYNINIGKNKRSNLGSFVGTWSLPKKLHTYKKPRSKKIDGVRQR